MIRQPFDVATRPAADIKRWPIDLGEGWFFEIERIGFEIKAWAVRVFPTVIPDKRDVCIGLVAVECAQCLAKEIHGCSVITSDFLRNGADVMLAPLSLANRVFLLPWASHCP